MEDINKPSADPEQDWWRPLSHEERRRHEILFYNQGPMDGFLPGDHARALFLRSKLPLHVLSQIWNLVDQPQDNVLDVAEFSTAMHLLQATVRGIPLPRETLPPALAPDWSTGEVRVPPMSKRELSAYKRLFVEVDKEKAGKLQASVVREVLTTSLVAPPTLGRVWDLSDLDRDGRLGVDEFCIACHLTRQAKKGKIDLDGSINVFSVLPHRQLKTDLAAKKARMAELEDRKKRLMKIRTKKQSDASRESERAKIWRERLEILKRRHQALRDDPAGIDDVVLRREEAQVERAESVVTETEHVSDRLDQEQKQIRKHTAGVIMEAEKLSTEVRKLQDEVNRLRENRRRTSQLKDLDPFHQLFEDRKEESLTGIPTPKKDFDIHIPFQHDPFSLADLEPSAFISGDDLFNATTSTPNAKPSQHNNNNNDPWAPSGVGVDLAELTLGFEDSFVDTWGTNGPVAGRDTNRNLLPEMETGAEPWEINSLMDDEDSVIFRTVSVTEEEDDLWSSLPAETLATQGEAFTYLQNRWSATTDRLTALDGGQSQPRMRAGDHGDSQSQPSERSGDHGDSQSNAVIPSNPAETVPLAEFSSTSNSPVKSPEPLPDNPRPSLPRYLQQTSGSDPETSQTNQSEASKPDIDINAIEHDSVSDSKTVIPCAKNVIVKDGSNDGLTKTDKNDNHKESFHALEDLSSPKAVNQSPENNIFSLRQIVKRDNSVTSPKKYASPPTPATPAKQESTPVLEKQGSTPVLEKQESTPILSKQESQSSCESSRPKVPTRRKKSVRLAQGPESSRESTPNASVASSPHAPPRSRSLKKKYPAPKPPNVESQTNARQQLNFDGTESQNKDQKVENLLRRTASLPVKNCVVLNQRNSVNGSEDLLSDPSAPPPKPPPRLKKRLRQSQSMLLHKRPDFTKDNILRSASVPAEENPSVYENFEFKQRVPDKIEEEPVKVTEPAAEGEVSIITINKSTTAKDDRVSVIQLNEDGPFSRTEINSDGEKKHVLDNLDPEPSLDDAIPTNPESAVDDVTQPQESLYVNVVSIAESSTDQQQDPNQVDEPHIDEEVVTNNTDEDIAANMEARKNELEKLRAQFFKKHQQNPAAVAPDVTVNTPNVAMTTSTMVTVGSETNDQNATLIQVTSDVPRSPSPSSLYGIIKDKQRSQSNNASPEQHKDNSKIILDLDNHQMDREIAPEPSGRKFLLDLDDHQTQREFQAPEDLSAPKAQSRMILDLDDFSSSRELDSGFSSSNNNTLASTMGSFDEILQPTPPLIPELGPSPSRAKMVLDLDEIQTIPDIEKKSLQENASIFDAPVPKSFDGSDDNLTSAASTPDSPAAWKVVEDSDISDGEHSFSATFTPGGDSMSEYRSSIDDITEDSGIVLVSYQQQPGTKDYVGLESSLQRSNKNLSDTGQELDPFDPFSPLWGATTKDVTSKSVELSSNRDNKLFEGVPSAPDAFNLSNLDTAHNQTYNPLSPSSDLNELVAVDNTVNLDLGKSSSVEGLGGSQDDHRTAYNSYNTVPTVRLMDHPPKMDPSDELLSKTTDSDKYNVTATLEITSAYSTEKNTAQGDTNLQDIDDRSKTSSPASRESLHLDLSGPATPERRDSSLTEDDMDPNTGLRRTDFLLPMSPMEKAVKFVENTELTYKVKKKDIPGGSSEPLSPEKIAISLELEQERNEIMGAMRVRKKRLDSWLDVKETPVDTAKWKSDSERRYEERKRQKEGKLPSPDRDDVIDVSQVPAPHWSAVIKDPNYYDPDESYDDDSADADAKFATQTITTTSTTKEAWQGSTNQHPDHSSVSSNDSYQKHVVDDNSNIYTATVPTATVPTVTHHESTIEKEIRIARERENELKEERLRAQASPSVTMPIHKIPDPVVVDDYRRGPPLSPVPPASSPLPPQAAHASYRELPEADRDPAMTKRGESIIEREIREQLDREKSQREEGMYKAEIQQDKEAEQSEFERQEKEHERVAHESIVAREVREQREREQEVQYLRTTTTVTTVTSDPPPSPRVTSPLPPKQTVAMTTVAEEESVPRVQYEEAIQTKTHKGESFIERELREQREREEELHSRYKEMGLGEMLANQEPSDTPFNRPEPAQPDITKLPLHAKTTITGRRMTKSVSEPVHLSAGLPPPPRAQRASMVVTQEVTRTPEPPALAPAEPEPPRAMAREEVDGYDVSYRFVPQNETPIEREMRLSREREEELRLSRGIPNARRDDDDAVMELPSDLPKHESRATDVRHIQRFASSRLQHEIEKEKRREMDLKSQGMISTLSEERVSGPTKYVDVIPHEQNIKTIPNWKQPRPANFDAPDAKVTSPEPRNGVSPVPNAAAKKEPAVGKQYASHTRTLLDKDGDRYRSRATPNTAESRIEQELREMKDREEELRPYDDFDESVSLHRSISDYRVGFDNGDIKGSSPVPANGHEPELRAHSSSGDSVKASRRKSALAEEWEKKFGAN